MNSKNEDPRVDLSWKRYLFPPMHKEGLRFVGIFAGMTALLFLMSCAVGLVAPLFVFGLLATIFTFYFFRNPNRVVPQGEGLIIAPADGIVSNIKEVVPPAEIDMGDEPLTRISIFMSVFNVHVNRMPVSGKIHKINYRPGKFLNVADKDSEDNEREEYSAIMDNGTKVGFVQIAGLVARRIVSFVKEGDELKAGDRFGLIRFGSRLDVFLPKGVAPKVALGQISIAGETILADLNGTQKALEGEDK
ncbi:MAG: phosphatidylserine decarboxylase [Alphaproteobacteria bacterium]|nr:phosphatidylserine decarboxylase [Alphaproteobacteria bacterium]